MIIYEETSASRSNIKQEEAYPVPLQLLKHPVGIAAIVKHSCVKNNKRITEHTKVSA